ncbi:hypothetical protein B0H13DRAFT_1853713 [Mycena leptocephala]|nr:hypothetical protein B0H13DRAFT_1853713 [Mycena leptocephala]
MPPRAWLANYRHYLERLLLSVEELSDPHWEPDTSIDVFLQARVRPAVYFLQQCTVGEGGLQGPPINIPSSEREELRLLALRLAGTVCFLSRVRVYRGLVETAPTLPLLLQDAPGISLENYRVPGCAANMMSIIMVLLGRLCDVEDRDLSSERPVAGAVLRDRSRPGRFRPLNPMPPSTPKTGVRVRDEFLNCDFSTVGQMVDFAHHPFMARVSREILEPLYQFFLRIREDFTWSPETKTKGEKRVMRQRVRDYLEMAGCLSDYVIHHHDLAEAKRIPTPRVAWLQVVMRADSVYGFEGDDNQLLRVILRGKIASLLQYSERLRQHAVDRIVERDDEGTRTQPSASQYSLPRVEFPMSYFLFPPPRTVAEVVPIHQLVIARMDSYCSVHIAGLQLASTKFAHVEYVREHLRPFCELIRGCIPSAVTVPEDLPDGRAEFLRPYVGAYLEKAAFLYSAALEYAKSNIEAPFLDPSVIWSLTMARTFHYMIGRPTYGYSRECCDAFLGRISSALSFADRTRTSASHTDVPLSVEIASLPHVPLWTCDRINHLCILELNDAWTCENALLQDEIEASQGIGRGLEKAVAQAEADYGQNPSGRRHSTARRFSKEELVILWIHRSRHLAQQLHRTTRTAPVAETPEATMGLIRDAVSVLLKNMVALGKASVTYGKHAEGEEPAFFVPSEGTTLFGMAERFVDLYGFHEDSSLLDRAILFENLCTLQEAMIRNPGYLELGIDFPNFDLSSTELEWYGIFPFYKARQIALLSATHFRHRKFGGELLRYNPELGEEGSTRSGLGAATGRILMREWTGVVVGELYYGWNVKSSRILPLVAHRNTSPRMLQLVIRRPDGPPSAISRNAHILQELCLPLETLDTLGFTPDEPWSEFFEFRLRPMVYLVHAGVTQGFSLIGRKGVYSLGELEEIRHWVHQALLHCRLLLVCRKALQPVYEDDFSISCPPTWGIPGEAVAMFEIMYRICLSIGFPCSDDSLCPLDRHVLLPLIMGARETCALLKTADDYSAYNRFGEVVDADRSVEGPRLLTPKARVRGKSIGRKPEVTARMALWGMCERLAKIGIGVFFSRGGHLPENPGENALCTCVPVFLVITSLRSLVLVYCWCSAAEFPSVPIYLMKQWTGLAITRRSGKRANTCAVGSVSGSDIFVHQSQTGTPSVHESSSSSASYVESASGSESDDDLVDPADLLSSLPAKSPKDAKTQKRPVDAMDVYEEVAAPPPKKAHRSSNKGSAVSNAAESASKPAESSAIPSLSEPLSGPHRSGGASSSATAPRSKTQVVDLETIEIEEKLQINDSFDFDVRRSSVEGISRMYEFYTRDAEEIGKEYKKVEARDPDGFHRTVEYFSQEGFALSRTGEWLLSFGETIGHLVSFYNAVLLVFIAFQYRYSLVKPLDALPSDPDDPVFLDARNPQPRWKRYTRDAFPPFDGKPHSSMAAYEDAWNNYKQALAKHDASESEKETAFLEKQRSSRVLTYIEERKRSVAEFETRRNMLGCYILFRVRTQFEGEDRVLDRGFPPPAPAQAPRRLPVRVAAAPPPPPAPVPRVRAKAMSAEPDIAVLEQGSNSGSDDVPLSVQRKSKGKKKAVVAPRESREKSRAESEGEPEVDPEIITCTVKVKKGKRQSAVELTGPKNEYDSQLWHDRNDLFVIDAPTTSTGGNKIVTHAYPYDENHLRFSGMRPLPSGRQRVRSPVLRRRDPNGCVHPLPRGQHDLRIVARRIRLGNDRRRSPGRERRVDGAPTHAHARDRGRGPAH